MALNGIPNNLPPDFSHRWPRIEHTGPSVGSMELTWPSVRRHGVWVRVAQWRHPRNFQCISSPENFTNANLKQWTCNAEFVVNAFISEQQNLCTLALLVLPSYACGRSGLRPTSWGSRSHPIARRTVVQRWSPVPLETIIRTPTGARRCPTTVDVLRLILVLLYRVNVLNRCYKKLKELLWPDQKKFQLLTYFKWTETLNPNMGIFISTTSDA